MKTQKRKVLFIGWDAADWDHINPLLEKGLLPNLKKLIAEGASGKISTLIPPFSPILWTSIATGKTADKHGVLGFIEPNIQAGGVRQVHGTSRKVKAIWNILTGNGYKTNVVAWWPTHPAEPINGVMVSNLFYQPEQQDENGWEATKGAVHPKSLEDTINELRVHPNEMTEAHVFPFVPDIQKMVQGEIKEEWQARLNKIAHHISHSASVQAVGTWVLENTEWDFSAIYFYAMDHFFHDFMMFYPPKQPQVSEEDYQLFRNVVDSVYLFYDMMLGRLIDLAGEDTTIMLASDHGFYSNHLRLTHIPQVPGGPAHEHNPYGIFCVKGEGISKGKKVFGTNLLDITPTLLTLFGLPIGKDMDGKPALQIFDNPPEVQYIESWEQVEGNFGLHSKEMIEDVIGGQEALQQLIELGYIEDPGEDNKKAAEQASNELQFNLGRALQGRGKHQEAIEVYERIFPHKKQDVRIYLDLMKCYLNTDNAKEARRIHNEFKKLFKDSLNIQFFDARILLLEDRVYEAIKILSALLESNIEDAKISVLLGHSFLLVSRYLDATEAYLKGLKIDTTNIEAHQGLAVAYLRNGQLEEAADAALEAINLIYHYPNAHYILGEALYKMELYEEAAKAFEVCLSMVAGMMRARKYLIKAYQALGRTEEVEIHQNILDKQMKGTVTIVSGLPRSGTSMMMQMLEKGGLEILTDKVRTPDNSNPKGYYEFEPVKKLVQDQSWLPQAEGKVVKVIAQLLKFLPAEFNYRIVFMQRNMGEVLRSQQVMLGKNPDVYPAPIAEAFAKELDKVKIWEEKEPHVEILYVDYTETIENPLKVAHQVNDFLGGILEVENMVEAVDKQLYRNKLAPTKES